MSKNVLDISEIESFTLEKMLAVSQEDYLWESKYRCQFFKKGNKQYSMTFSDLEEKQNANNMSELFKVKMKE